MIRHFNGKNAGRISHQAQRGKIIALEWTWRKHRICLTRKRADRGRRAWQEWYRRQGWDVIGSRATNPETGERHVIEVTEYDPKTLKRIYPEFKPRPEPKAREAAPRRRGRKPIAA